MLSRVAESLFWMARSLERAEDLARLLAVTFNAQLEAQHEIGAGSWASVVVAAGDEALFAEAFGDPTAETVAEFVLWHPLNPSSVIASVTRARENARSVREQVSSEMWERLNRFYFRLRELDRAETIRNPNEVSIIVREATQAFEGVTAATMAHGEGYEFIQLGLHVERADKTMRILGARHGVLAHLPPGSPEMSLELITLLRSCSAFEPFRRVQGGTLEVAPVLEYLLLDRQFPRAVLFCLGEALRSLDRISDGAWRRPEARADRPDGARRVLGRLCADLEFLEADDLVGAEMDDLLGDLLGRLNEAGDEIARTYFSTQVIIDGGHPRQHQQQQQQQGRDQRPGPRVTA